MLLCGTGFWFGCASTVEKATQNISSEQVTMVSADTPVRSIGGKNLEDHENNFSVKKRIGAQKRSSSPVKASLSSLWKRWRRPRPEAVVDELQIMIVKKDRELHEAKLQTTFKRARQLESQGEWAAAGKIYNRLIKYNPQWCDPYHRLAVCADQQGRYEEAETFYRQALKIKPTDANLLNDLGYCYYLQEKWKNAEAILNRAVEVAPTNPRICNNLGLVYGRLGKADEALQTFRRVSSEEDAQHNLKVVIAAYEEQQSSTTSREAKISWDAKVKQLYTEGAVETSRVPQTTKIR
jgi:Flp pilus assembly protein TadD